MLLWKLNDHKWQRICSLVQEKNAPRAHERGYMTFRKCGFVGSAGGSALAKPARRNRAMVYDLYSVLRLFVKRYIGESFKDLGRRSGNRVPCQRPHHREGISICRRRKKG